jgi:hypothetical protein
MGFLDIYGLVRTASVHLISASQPLTGFMHNVQIFELDAVNDSLGFSRA